MNNYNLSRQQNNRNSVTLHQDLDQFIDLIHISSASASRAAAGPHLNQRPSAPPPPQPDIKEPVNILESIEPKPHATRRKAGRATAKELSDGIFISLSILTSIVAMLLRTPDLAMSDIESQNIAIPAGNLLEPTKFNERFGRMIAESGDYQILGYASWLYISRVANTIKEKQNTGGGNQNIPPPRQPAPQQNGAYNPQYHTALSYVQRSTPIVRPGGAL